MKRFGTHLLIVASSAGIAVACRLALHPWDVVLEHNLTTVAATERSREIAEHWKRRAQDDIHKPDFVERLSRKAEGAALDLSDLERSELIATLTNIIEYLASPSIERYVGIKTQGVAWRWTSAGRIAQNSAQAAQGEGRWLSNENLGDAARTVWRSLYGLNGQPSGLTGLGLSDLALAVAEEDTPGALLRGRVHKGFTLAREAAGLVFDYPGLNAGNGTQAQKPLFVHVSFFGTVGKPFRAGPMYLSLGWSPAEKRWVVTHLIVDSALGAEFIL